MMYYHLSLPDCHVTISGSGHVIHTVIARDNHVYGDRLLDKRASDVTVIMTYGLGTRLWTLLGSCDPNPLRRHLNVRA